LKQIGEDDWNRTGVYLEGGEMTLLEILQTTINHRLSHMDQIKR
jgi:hypothetical protein